MHVVSDHHKRAGLPLNPSAGCEQGHLQMPPVGCLNFVLFLNFSILREVKLEEKIGVNVAGSEPVELHLLMLLDQYMHLERLELFVELEDHIHTG